MSSLRPIDLRLVDEFVDFIRGPGYVLDFSDSAFAAFFREHDIDIDDPAYAVHGTSKGKRLRCFLQTVDNATASRILHAIWEHRAACLTQIGHPDPIENAEGRFLTLVARLNNIPGTERDLTPLPATDRALFARLCNDLAQIVNLQPQARCYAFENFLRSSFNAAGLEAREPFRNMGEQIDGSFLLGQEIYLLEAKWHAVPTGAADLHVFHGKIEQKAAWARGLFVSYNGFTADGLAAFGTGKRLICMDGRDLYNALKYQIPLRALLERKVRCAAETGRIFAPISELFRT